MHLRKLSGVCSETRVSVELAEPVSSVAKATLPPPGTVDAKFDTMGSIQPPLPRFRYPERIYCAPSATYSHETDALGDNKEISRFDSSQELVYIFSKNTSPPKIVIATA